MGGIAPVGLTGHKHSAVKRGCSRENSRVTVSTAVPYKEHFLGNASCVKMNRL